MAHLALHQHGKSKVRLGRVWRQGSTHVFVEWNVQCLLESDMEHAYLTDSNAGMTATDTVKNTVYYVAKQLPEPCSPEEYALALGRHFCRTYPLVSKAKISVEASPWVRHNTPQGPHEHGFVEQGAEMRTCYVEVSKSGVEEVTSGLKDLKVLKTTQSGYAGFLHDKYTVLPDTNERMVASVVTTTWKYSKQPANFCAAYSKAREAMLAAFYGPARGGVFSPSVQFTLFRMGKGAIESVPEISSVFLNMPNVHFLPCNPVTGPKFNNDLYISTSEPHGSIEAVVTRGQVMPHCKL